MVSISLFIISTGIKTQCVSVFFWGLTEDCNHRDSLSESSEGLLGRRMWREHTCDFEEGGPFNQACC